MEEKSLSLLPGDRTVIGRRPLTGRLSVTWPRSEDQVPINVGDRRYDPLFPYGYGLRTRPAA